MDAAVLDELLDSAAALRAGSGRAILGLAGAPAAGKSTLAQRLADRDPERTIVVPMDGFHLAHRELVRLGRAGRKGAPDTFDVDGYRALLARLRAATNGEIVYAPAFARELEEPIAGAIAVLPEHTLVITEGNYLLYDDGGWARVPELLDAVWFVEIDDDRRRERLLERHVRFGRTESEARAWVASTDDPNARLIAATRGRADRIVHLVGNR